MKSLLLMSVILVTFIVPVVTARDPIPARGLKRMVRFFILFVPLYYLYVAYGHTKFFVPSR
jgi:hypothetical protein